MSLVLMAGLASSPLSARAGGPISGELKPGQLREAEAGKQVIEFEEVDGVPWPRITVYQVVDASPEEVAAVFFDYGAAKTFIPNVLKSDVSKVVSPCVVEVDYGIDVPIFPDEFYTARNSLSKAGEDVYKVEWKLLRAVQTKDAVGNMIVEPHGDKTLLRYRNLTVPSSSIAGLLKGPAIDRMKGTVQAICREAGRQKKEDPKGLETRVQALRKALAGG